MCVSVGLARPVSTTVASCALAYERGMSCPALSAAALLNCSATVMPPRLLPLMMRLPTLGLLPLLQLVSRTFGLGRRGQKSSY